MNSRGFYPDSGLITADSDVHRFKRNSTDKNKNAWYIGYINNIPGKPEPMIVVLYGDWVEQETITFCSYASRDASERKIYEQIIAKAKKDREEVQKTIWEETAINAEKKYLFLTENCHSGVETASYFQRKKISNLYGSRIQTGTNGAEIYIPLRDTYGKIWSFQQIKDDGSKRFMPGGKIKGNFHVIGGELNPLNTIYIAEGFATAASIHEAIGQVVVVAFNSGNLKPVAKAIKEAYPEAPIIICGDEDLFTVVNNAPLNPGREAAIEAAKSVMGEVVFPKFKSLVNKPTDFNDLAVEESLEAVKELIKPIKASSHYVFGLGHKDLMYFYTTNYNKQVIQLLNHSPDHLMDLQPLEYWESHFPTKSGVDWKRAQSWLKQKCVTRGIFRTSKVRGLGVWRDGQRIVVHLGNRLLVDGKEIGLHSLKSEYIYSLEEIQRDVSNEPLNVKECELLVNAIKGMAWSRPQDHNYFLGWIMSSMVCGILPWRPHLWLVGSSGAGKTTVYELIGKLSHYPIHKFAGGSTEAGLRRSVKGSAIPVMFDEFELNKNSLETNQQILEFMRQASSETESRVVKADGQSGVVAYDPRFCAFVSGIKPSLTNEADRNRFTLIELDKKKQNPSQWGNVLALLKKIDKEYAERLFSRALRMAPVLEKNIEVFRDSLTQKFKARFADQYSPILAGYYSLLSDDLISKEDALAYVESLGLEREESENQDHSDEDELLSIILTSKVSSDWGQRSIAELIKIAASPNPIISSPNNDNKVAQDTLIRHGLKYTIEDKLLFISSTNQALSEILKSTRYAVNWNTVLKRRSGSKSHKVRIDGPQKRGILIPFDASDID